MNPQIGKQIRNKLAERLKEALNLHPEAQDLYFVAHSLGTAILWDILFSKKLPSNDPAWDVRLLLTDKISLRGIATMGSPIPFVNMALGITSNEVESKLREYIEFQGDSLKWLNFIHSSDVIAYPLRPTLGLVDPSLLQLKDIYITSEFIDKGIDGFAQSKVSQLVGGMSSDFKEALEYLPAIVGTSLGHGSYFQQDQVAQELAELIHPTSSEQRCADKKIQDVIKQLRKVPGMTEVDFRIGQHIDDLPDSDYETVVQLGTTGIKVRLTRNLLRTYHITVVDGKDVIAYFGYVGWIHTEGLKTAVQNLRDEHNLNTVI